MNAAVRLSGNAEEFKDLVSKQICICLSNEKMPVMDVLNEAQMSCSTGSEVCTMLIIKELH